MAKANTNPISFSQFVQAGLINDVDVGVKSARCVMWDYDGHMASEVCAVKFVLVDGEGEEHENYWSVGGKEGDFIPTKDGKFLHSPSGRTSLNKGSNFHLLVESLFACGMPPDFLTTDLSVLEGLKGHIIRKPAPKRNIEGSKKREDGREPEVLVFTEVKKAPWDSKGGARRSSAKPKASDDDDSNESDSNEGGDMDAILAKLIKKTLMENGGEMELDDLGIAVYKESADTLSKDDRKQIMPKLNDSDWLKDTAGVTVDGDKASL